VFWLFNMGKWLLEEAAELLYPTRCCFCHRFTGKNIPVCKNCQPKYPDLSREAQCRILRRDVKSYSPLRYEGNVREALLRYKFSSVTAYARIFAGYMTQCLDEHGITCDVVTWVPLSRKRYRRRGFDQAQLLAKKLAAQEGWPLERLLKKTRDTRAQSGLKSREQRQANAAGAYGIIHPERAAGKDVLLVDDIVTSGATLQECARILKLAGAKSVTAVTVASRTGD